MSHDAAQFRLLYELGCAFAARLELEELVPLVMAQCRAVLDAEGVAVLRYDATRQEFFFPYVAEEDPDVAQSLKRLRLPAHRGIAGAVLESGEAVRIDDVTKDPRFYDAIDRLSGLTTRSLLAAPLTTRHGKHGVIEVVNRRGGGPFTDADLDFLKALSGSIAVALENAQLWQESKTATARLQAEVGVLRRDLEQRDRFGLIGRSPAMKAVYELMASAAASPIAVLLEGETGTGKELVARGIHRASARAKAPFVAVNCAAMPEALLESELFGHRRGAFTGATKDQPGFFETASGGTIFLDEIGEMPAGMQAKLLRVLQEGEVVPVGERQPIPIDVRVISATNRELSRATSESCFRDDLYYRLAAFPIRLPPLRERREDMPLLIEHFLGVAATRHGKRVVGIDPAAIEPMLAFGWPGNVRELQNEIERAVALLADGGTIGVAQLSAKISLPAPPSADGGAVAKVASAGAYSDLRDARTAFEVAFIGNVLRDHGGNVSRTAVALGISRVALQKKMKEHGLR